MKEQSNLLHLRDVIKKRVKSDDDKEKMHRYFQEYPFFKELESRLEKKHITALYDQMLVESSLIGEVVLFQRSSMHSEVLIAR